MGLFRSKEVVALDVAAGKVAALEPVRLSGR
jgi:hypothetical protein